MAETKIEWATHSLNFIKWFCTKISPGCKNCYMMALAKRYPQNAADHPVWRDKAWDELRKFPSGAQVFVGDMYDLFHEQMPREFIDLHLQAAQSRPDITFMFLTKRIDRVPAGLQWGENCYLGTSVESRRYLRRIDALRGINVNRFLSIEPLLEDLGDVSFAGIDQVIVGGESGDQHRPFDKAWATHIRQQCQHDGVPFFFKQSGARFPGQDRMLDGVTWDDLAWRAVPAESTMQTSLF